MKKNTKVNKVNQELKEEAIKLKGLKKFLLDFSMMPGKEYFEVPIWEEYLIFAQILGIADKVEEQFSKLYPNFNKESMLNTEITTVAIRNMARIEYESMKEGERIVASSRIHSSSYSHDYSGRSTYSGSGGSSYSSGGSSSGGSSGGGFR